MCRSIEGAWSCSILQHLAWLRQNAEQVADQAESEVNHGLERRRQGRRRPVLCCLRLNSERVDSVGFDMASVSERQRLAVVAALLALCLAACAARAQLSPGFYSATCPAVESIVRAAMAGVVGQDLRMGASVIRLFFHDCFVNGCDGSVLLDDTPTMVGEKNAVGNANSLRGYEVVDAIKSSVEAACRATVSCADIVALAARDAVSLLGGPSWQVALGRRDSSTASMAAANADLPPASDNISTLVAKFAAKGLDLRDLTALAGAHTVGLARCVNFRQHVYNDANVDPAFAMFRRRICPAAGGDSNLAALDTTSPNRFDVSYYRDLMARRALLHSDQELFNGGPADDLVRLYSNNGGAFDRDFAAAMVKLGNLTPLTGSAGEIRLNCRKAN